MKNDIPDNVIQFPEKSLEDKDDISYSLTPKGLIAAKLIIWGLSTEQAMELWDELEEFVGKKAIQNGMPEGDMACLVFHEGGVCITAEKKQ